MTDHRSPPDDDLAGAVRDPTAEDAALEIEPPPSEEELVAAERLRHALRAAGAPGHLAPDVHERLLAAALGEDAAAPGPAIHDAPALARGSLEEVVSRGERRAAARLGERLEQGLRRDPDAEPDDEIEALVELAAAVQVAHAPPALDDLAAERTLARHGLGRHGLARHGLGRRAVGGDEARPSRVLRVAWGVGLAAAAAAAAMGALPCAGLLGQPAATAALVPARSTGDLFDPSEPFPRQGGTSDRIDRISASRRSDLRQNRFARWGIR